MSKKGITIVRIVATIGIGILCAFRNDYPVATILFVWAIAEISEFRSFPKRIRYSFSAKGVQTVRDGLKGTADEAYEEILSFAKRGKTVAVILVTSDLYRLRLNSQYIRLVRYKSDIDPPTGYSYEGSLWNMDIFSLLPADPPAPNSPSE